jgi:PAS domain S-box-containing protein
MLTVLQTMIQQSPVHQYFLAPDGSVLFNNRDKAPDAITYPLPDPCPDDFIIEIPGEALAERWTRILLTAVHHPDGSLQGTIGCELDVSDQIKLIAELQHEHRLLDSIMEYMPDRIYFKDLESRFIRASREVLNAAGVQHESDIIGKTDGDFFQGTHAEKALQDEQRVIQTGEGLIEIEEIEEFKDGRCFWLSTTKVPLYDENRTIIGTMGVSRKITHLKELEIQHRQIIKDLETALSQVKQLSGMVPICSYCRKIRDDDGFWHLIEEYLHRHSDAEFSHGICDACVQKHFPELSETES